MTEQSKLPIDGIYVAYFTGEAGSSIGMFVFRQGVVAGADAGGGRYDGEYTLSEDGESIAATIKFLLPIGNSSITGASAETEPMALNVPLTLPVEFNRTDVHRIDTPIGPINAKFEKVREL